MKKIIGALLFMVLMIPVLSLAAYPEDLEEEANYDGLIELISQEPIDTSNMVEDDIYGIDQEVVIDKIVDGNVYVMAQNLKIENATIYGNVYAIAEKIEIQNSQINGSVYAIGETINISATMNDLYATGSQINCNENSSIWRSAKIVAGTLKISGNIGRDLYASIENIDIADSATIRGKLNYSSKAEGDISQNAQIGEVEFVQAKPIEKNVKTTGDYIMELVAIAFKTLIIALIIVFFVNKMKVLPRKNTTSEVFMQIGKGFGVLVVVPVIALILMLSILGTALGISLLAIYIVFVYLATTILAVEIAYRIEKENKAKIIGIAILVSIVLTAIGWIPRIGGVVEFIALLIGLGILFDMIFKRIKKEANNGEINEN